MILGYGREGRSVHQFLKRFYPDIRVSIADQNQINDIQLPIDQTFFGYDYLEYLFGFESVVRSPGIPIGNERLNSFIKSGGWVTSITNIFLSLFGKQVIGVTGSKGKSTTAALISEILKSHYSDVQLVGNIGHPALDNIEKITPETKIVMELSSHQLEDVRYSPHTAVILRLFPEHLDYYPDYQTYVKAKLNITKWLNNDDKLILNQNEDELVKLTERCNAHKYFFGLDKTEKSILWVEDDRVMTRQSDKISELMPVSEVGLNGRGNLENVLAALSVGLLHGIPAEKMRPAVREFSGLPHRLEYVGKFKEIEFYNDSLATVPEATIAGCEALGENVETLILGGLDRKLDQEKLADYLINHRQIRNLILFPETGIKIGQLISRGTDHGKNLFRVTDMKSAIRTAFQKTGAGKICLLSPAAPSFNLFKDYADRGEQFKKFVKEFANNN